MNREIKFRAWHRVEETILFVGDKFGTTDPLDCCGYLQEGQPVDLMQYTGLKDKNGVEIYEGDIVSGWTHNPSEPHVVKYISDKYNCCFMASSVSGHGKIHVWYDGLEVIGNIYENPELINP